MGCRVVVTRGRHHVARYLEALAPYAVTAVELAAGTPEAARAIEAPGDVLGDVAGLLLPGGGDADPRWYGDTWVHPTVSIDAERDALELALARWAIATEVPVLGICRGIQVLNVAAGGGLWQDIPAQYPSTLTHLEPAPNRDRQARLHSVGVLPGSLTRHLLGGQKVLVNSIHHQAVRCVAPGWRTTALAPDGIVEAIERSGSRFALGVQWHPEELVRDDAAARALFEAFCAAAWRPSH